MLRALFTRTCLPVVLAAALAAWAVPATAQGEFTQIGVVVNVLKGANPCTDDQIKDAIAEANKLLSQAKVELVHKKTNRDVSDGGDDDGKVTPAEGDKLRKSGQAELDAVVGNGKAFKLYISKTCDTTDPLAIGVTVHGTPVSITEHPPAKEDFGWVITHEFCHAYTLTGHKAPDGSDWGADNIMHAKFGRGGKTLTDAQKAEIKKTADERGKTKTQSSPSSPPQKKSQEGGSAPDPRSGEGGEVPGIPPKSDLRRSEMFSDNTVGLMRGNVQMHGLLNPQSLTQVQCFQYIDADANPGTGQHVVVDGRSIGAEYRIEITVSGSGGGTLQLLGRIYNTTTLANIPLSALVLETEYLHSCSGDTVDQVPLLDQLNCEFPRSFMGALVLPCRVGTRFTDLVGGTIDETGFDLQNQTAATPTLTLDAYLVPPGGPALVLGSGFTPNVDVTIYNDDSQAAIVHTSFAGTFSTPITILPPGNTYHWIDGREANGGPSDFSIVHVVSSGGVPAVGAWGLVALVAVLVAAGVVASSKRAATRVA